MILAAPLELIPWSKLHPVGFAYSMADPSVSFFEKELVLPPFSRFALIGLTGHNKAFDSNEFARITPNHMLDTVRAAREKWVEQLKSKTFSTTQR